MKQIFIFLIVSWAPMTLGAQDFLIRYNSTLSPTIPDGGAYLDIAYPSGKDSSGTSITYNNAAEEWNLADTGRYLVMYSDHTKCTSTTNNERINMVYELEIAATTSAIGRSSGYIRKRNGAQDAIVNGYGIIRVTSANTKVKLKARRVDDVVGAAERPQRVVNRSGMMIMKLSDAWNYARYETTSPINLPTTEGASQAITWGSTVEQDSPFSLLGGSQTIDIASNNLILAVSTLPIQGAGSDSRFDLYSRLEIGVAQRRTAWTFIRNNGNNCDDGCLSSAYIWEHVSGEDIGVNVYVNEVGVTIPPATQQVITGANLQLVELPAAAKFITLSATTGEMNSVNLDFDWDNTGHIDADQFTHTTGTDLIEVDSADSYLLFTGQFDDDDYFAFRAQPSSRIELNGNPEPHMGASAYFRGSGTNCRGGMNMGAILPNLSASDDIRINNDRLGSTANSIDVDEAYFTMVKMGSLFQGGGGPVIEINAIIDPPEINGIDAAEINGI